MSSTRYHSCERVLLKASAAAQERRTSNVVCLMSDARYTARILCRDMGLAGALGQSMLMLILTLTLAVLH